MENTSESISPEILRLKADIEELKKRVQSLEQFVSENKPLLSNLKEAAAIENVEGEED